MTAKKPTKPVKKNANPVKKTAKKAAVKKKMSQVDSVAQMYKKAGNDPFKIPGFKAGRGTE